MKNLVFKNITELHAHSGLPEPENPLFSASHIVKKDNSIESCNEGNEVISLICNFYSISLKNIVSGELVYGRTKYDCTNGVLLFTAPNQKLIFKGLAFSSEAFHINFHKDYLNGSQLFDKIKKYSFFNYQANEALHLSPKEEEVLKTIFKNIEIEYHNNQDEFSKEIILSHLETLLKYANRFYKRQFFHRKDINQELFTRFKNVLDRYFSTNQLVEKGYQLLNGWLIN